MNSQKIAEFKNSVVTWITLLVIAAFIMISISMNTMHGIAESHVNAIKEVKFTSLVESVVSCETTYNGMADYMLLTINALDDESDSKLLEKLMYVYDVYIDKQNIYTDIVENELKPLYNFTSSIPYRSSEIMDPYIQAMRSEKYREIVNAINNVADENLGKFFLTLDSNCNKFYLSYNIVSSKL